MFYNIYYILCYIILYLIDFVYRKCRSLARCQELLKLRLLNAVHQALSYPAALLGYEVVHEAVADRRVFQFLKAHIKWLKRLKRSFKRAFLSLFIAFLKAFELRPTWLRPGRRYAP